MLLACIVKNEELQAEIERLKDEIKKPHLTRTAEALHLRCAELRLQRDWAQEENDVRLAEHRELKIKNAELQKHIDADSSSLIRWSQGWDEGFKAKADNPSVGTLWKIQYETSQEEIKELKKDVKLLQFQKQQYYGKGWAEGWGACEASGFHGQKSPDVKQEIQMLRREAKDLKDEVEWLRKRRSKDLRQMTANDTTISKLIEENEKLKKTITKGHPALEELLTILRG
jgi:hypothetical protein